MLALRSDGTIVGWGPRSALVLATIPGLSGHTQLVAGGMHALALRANGSIACWGTDNWGQVGGAPGGPGFSQVAAGQLHSLALRTDGGIEAWGHDLYDQVSATPEGDGFLMIAAGGRHSLALRADGSIASWGDDSQGQVSDSPPDNGYIHVAAGDFFSMALREDGSIVAWGSDEDGELSDAPIGGGFVQLDGAVGRGLALRAANIGNPFCFGDGSGTACPCANPGAADEGCANSRGMGATLGAGGSASVMLDDLTFSAQGMNPGQTALLFSAGQQLNAGAGQIFADGLRCTGGGAIRHHIEFVSPAGTATWPAGFAAENRWVAGETRHFQAWYRNPATMTCGGAFNLTHGLTVLMAP